MPLVKTMQLSCLKLSQFWSAKLLESIMGHPHADREHNCGGVPCLRGLKCSNEEDSGLYVVCSKFRPTIIQLQNGQ